jgi:Family of unknown function (DUF5372)
MDARPSPSLKSRTAARASGEARIEIEVTHPFHPWRGKRFVLATRKQNWGEDRVMFFDAEGRLRSLLASWTNVDESDVFAQAAQGKSFLRPDDLADLAGVIDEIERGRAQRGRVK